MATPVSFTTVLTNPDATPLASTLISVFNAGVDQLATLSTNESGTAQANPLSTDGSGNLSFYANPGTYTLTYYDKSQSEHSVDVVVTPAGSATLFGANSSVTAAATTLVVSGLAAQPDTAYSVQATPSWGTTLFVTAKSTTGFTLNFGTAAPGGATVDWVINR